MSSVLPRSERNMSETMSKAGMTGAPQVRGQPRAAISCAFTASAAK